MYLGHASPTCSAGQTLQSNACNTMQGLGLRGVGLADSSEFRFFQGDLGVGLRPLQEHVGASACMFLESAGCPKEAASTPAAASPKKKTAR